MSRLQELRRELRSLADPSIAQHSAGFFKAGPGGYAEGGRFLGIRVPRLRELAKRYRDLDPRGRDSLLRSPFHEERLLAILMMTLRYEKGDAQEREQIFDYYLANTRYVNNWDLVDSSAHKIVGAHLLASDPGLLRELARSKDLWERRISMMSTLAFIKAGQVEVAYEIAEVLVSDAHDLIHKVVGWMLREAGKVDPRGEREFLERHLAAMPRTMLRYAIEKFPEEERQCFLRGEVKSRKARSKVPGPS
jgi:3-methyladenine DNA glycosylase AlkD